jgi:cation diffusion facilitator family transporter
MIVQNANQKAKNESMTAVWVSLISNIFLTVLKIVVGLLFHSNVLIADGIHNGADVIASLAALSSMRISARPADEDHPYGHGKAEVIASAMVSVILALASIYMAYESVLALFEEPKPQSIISLIAAVISLVWKQWLYVYTIRIGRAINSKGMIATAYDHLADVYASLAAVVGVGLALLGRRFPIPYSEYGDAFAGIIVSLFVLKLAYKMGKEAVEILMEKNVEPEKIEQYKDLILAVPQVKRIDRLRAREHGHYILVDIRVGIPGHLTIQEGHDISRAIKTAIMSAHGDVDEVLIHLNPWYENETDGQLR